MAAFSFSFSGDDIEDDGTDTTQDAGVSVGAAAVSEQPLQETAPPSTASAFPVQGKPQLPPRRHDLAEMLALLPSKIAYSLLDVALDSRSSEDGDSNGGSGAGAAREPPFRMRLPRRELWDVKVQLMAEEEATDDSGDNGNSGDNSDKKGGLHELAPGLGAHDVKTGIYEGGFKSWESSVDLVKVLLQPPAGPSSSPSLSSPSPSTPVPSPVAGNVLLKSGPAHIIELGCGTALPSLAVFHWACATASAGKAKATRAHPLSITVADYNPSVLYLVTLPNFLLAWALQQREVNPVLQQALAIDEDGDDDNGELELTDEVKQAFCAFLEAADISLSFLSGGWSPAFVELLLGESNGSNESTSADAAAAEPSTLVLGAETIYSPFALASFSDTLLAILRRRSAAPVASSTPSATATAVIGAKKLYFGVGGSLDDFVLRMREAGATVNELREEAEGVRRGVVQCLLG